MSFLSKEVELINFINSKILKKTKLEYNTILYYFTKVIKESILKSYERLKDLNWIQECSNIVFNIFWQILCYTYNVKLSMFLCERAILLFNEYIDLAKNTFKENNTDFKINSTDVKLFIYKRTIGPIKLTSRKSKQFNNIVSNIKYSSIKIKELLINISIHLIINKFDQTQLIEILDYIENLLPDILNKLYVNNIYFDFETYLTEIEKIKNYNEIIQYLNKIKIDMELYYYIYKKCNKNNNINFIFNLFSKLTYDNELNDIKLTKFNKKYNQNKEKYFVNKKNKFKKILN